MEWKQKLRRRKRKKTRVRFHALVAAKSQRNTEVRKQESNLSDFRFSPNKKGKLLLCNFN